MANTSGLCQCGCGGRAPIAKKTSRPDRVKGQPMRFINGHSPRRPLLARFFEKVEKTDGCWLWTGAIDSGGYGHIRVEGCLTSAHRVSWLLEHGFVPDELDVLHRCGNRRCVRPSHLFLGTHTDNMLDMVSKGRNRNRWTGPLQEVPA